MKNKILWMILILPLLVIGITSSVLAYPQIFNSEMNISISSTSNTSAVNVYGEGINWTHKIGENETYSRKVVYQIAREIGDQTDMAKLLNLMVNQTGDCYGITQFFGNYTELKEKQLDECEANKTKLIEDKADIKADRDSCLSIKSTCESDLKSQKNWTIGAGIVCLLIGGGFVYFWQTGRMGKKGKGEVPVMQQRRRVSQYE